MPGLMPNHRAGLKIVFRKCENFCLGGSWLACIVHCVHARLLILCSRMHSKYAYETPKACGVSRWGNGVVVVKMSKITAPVRGWRVYRRSCRPSEILSSVPSHQPIRASPPTRCAPLPFFAVARRTPLATCLAATNERFRLPRVLQGAVNRQV